MIVLSFLVHLFGATMLLLFAVRMVRTGIERAFGPSFQRVITRSKTPIKLSLLGVLLAILLQSSAAVTLLIAGFVGTGTLGFAHSMAIVLGGDLGSALLIQILSLRLDWLAPVLLTLGGILFLKTERRNFKQAGRIILGIAFILISLRFLREAVDPIRASGVLPAMSEFLTRDFITSFIFGTALAFVLHSSVAAILMCVTIVSLGALPLIVGASLIMGANVGSALIPMWLARGMSAESQRIPLGNLLIRGTAAIIAVIVLNKTPLLTLLPEFKPGQTLIILHICFNGILLFFLPLLRWIEAPTIAVFPAQIIPEAPKPMEHISVLTSADLHSPARSLAGLRREVLRMAGLISAMISPVMTFYETFDKTKVRALRDLDNVVNTALDGIRRYASDMPHTEMSHSQRKEMRALVDYAIALEAAGDIVAKRLLPLTQEKSQNDCKFSSDGFSELVGIHEHVVANLAAATNVLISSDIEIARLLLEEKAEISRLERSSRKRHLKRLSSGETDSFKSSDIHLETAYCLREFNSLVVSVAHPILIRNGQLLETRLIQDLPTTAT
jgi:phosphate:Na+ symporter